MWKHLLIIICLYLYQVKRLIHIPFLSKTRIAIYMNFQVENDDPEAHIQDELDRMR